MTKDASRFPNLTPAQRNAYEAGAMSDFQASSANMRNTPEKYGQGDFISPILDATRPQRQAMEVTLDKQQEPNPAVSPFIQKGNDLAVGTAKAVLNPWESLIKPTGQAVGQGASAGWDWAKNTAPGRIAGNAAEAVFVPQGKIQAKEAAQAQEAAGISQAADAEASSRIDAWDQITAALGGDQAGTIIGPAADGGGGGYTLPPPPEGTDFSGVQEAIDQTKPGDVAADVEAKRRGAIMTGLVGGMLKASMDDDATFGDMMKAGGLGVVKGMAAGDAYKTEAEGKFKEAMDTYWVRTAGVRQNQAESDSEYANRVYQTKLRQLEINASAAAARSKAGESTIRQSGDKFFVEEVVQTPQGPMRQIRPLDIGAVNRMGGMEKKVTEMLGGTPDAKEKAGAIVAEVAARKDPSYALPMLTVARMKGNGTYIDFVQKLSEADPSFQNAFNSVGIQLQGASGVKEGSLEAMADSRRDAMLVDLILKSDAARNLAYGFAGMDEQRIKGAK